MIRSETLTRSSWRRGLCVWPPCETGSSFHMQSGWPCIPSPAARWPGRKQGRDDVKLRGRDRKNKIIIIRRKTGGCTDGRPQTTNYCVEIGPLSQIVFPLHCEIVTSRSKLGVTQAKTISVFQCRNKASELKNRSDTGFLPKPAEPGGDKRKQLGQSPWLGEKYHAMVMTMSFDGLT